MKKIEVKKLEALNVFKVLAYTLTGPVLLISTIGMMLTPGGIGLVSVLFGGIVAIGFYGLLAMFITLFYNFFANKFGGLILMVEETTAEDEPKV